MEIYSSKIVISIPKIIIHAYSYYWLISLSAGLSI